MNPRHLHRRGFTLIELMMVVAIVGILAAIAIPNFVEYSLRSKQTEASLILGDLKTAQWSLYATHDCFAILEQTPAVAPVPGQRGTWLSAASPAGTAFCAGNTMSMEDVGVRTTGSGVYFQYECAAVDNPGAGSNFSCTAVGDLDADGAASEFAFCSDLDGDGLGLPTPLGTACPFVDQVVRLSVARF